MLNNNLVTVIGALVGSTGVILSYIMCTVSQTPLLLKHNKFVEYKLAIFWGHYLMQKLLQFISWTHLVKCLFLFYNNDCLDSRKWQLINYRFFQAMNRSLFHVISGGYGMVKGQKQLPVDSKKTIIEWKVDDTVQVRLTISVKLVFACHSLQKLILFVLFFSRT